MSGTEVFIKKEKNTPLMGELEDIAKELGDWVTYSFEDNIEILFCKDEKSRVGAVNAPTYQGFLYCVDVKYLDSYLEKLQEINNPLTQRIYENLNSRTIPNCPDGDQLLTGDYFELSDFKDVPKIMKMHKEFADD